MTRSGATPRRLGAAEREALLRLCGVAERGEPTAAQSLDWNAIQGYVAGAMSAQILRGIEQGRAGANVPPSFVARLKHNTRLLAALYVRRQSVLRAACRALSDADIPVIVLKGAALAHMVYPDPTLRPMGDLDLWVSPDRLAHAVTALGDRGFRPSADEVLRGPVAVNPGSLATRSLELADIPGIELELHGAVNSLAGMPCARFAVAWRAGETRSLGGVGARVLGPEHMLTHLGLHLARTHAFSRRLFHLVDVAMVVDQWRDRWPWRELVAEWRAARVWTWMLLTLTAARDLLGAPVPRDLERFAPLPVSWARMRSLAAERLWEANRHRLPPAAERLANAPSVGEMLRLLRRRVFDHYWSSSTPRSTAKAVRDAARHFWHDMRHKVPWYIWYWRHTRFSRLALDLHREGTELEELVRSTGDLGYAGSGTVGISPTAPVGAIAESQAL